MANAQQWINARRSNLCLMESNPYDNASVRPGREAAASSSRSVNGGYPSDNGEHDGLEATELAVTSGPSSPSDSAPAPPLRRLTTHPDQRPKRLGYVRRFWRHHVRVNVPHDLCRDHLGISSRSLSLNQPRC